MDRGEHDAGLPPPKSRVRSWLMFSVSMVLLAGAAYFVYNASDGLGNEWALLRGSPWWMVGLILLAPLGNHLSVAMCLHALQSRHGKVGVREMFVLVGSAWLFNYLPMRPGLIGRIGYHKSINKIRIRDSLESSIWSGVLAGISNSILVLVALLMARFPQWWSILFPTIPVLLMFVLSAMMPGKRSRLLMIALAYRQIDVIVWLGRYWIAFEVLGLEISMADLAMVSAVSQFASLMPLTGSGLGFREWTVGLMATAGGHAMDTAMAGDLINRIAETIIVVPVGLVCTALVAQHWKRVRAAGLLSDATLTEDDARSDSQHEDPAGDAQQQDPSVG